MSSKTFSSSTEKCLAMTYFHNYLRRNCDNYRILQPTWSDNTNENQGCQVIPPFVTQPPMQFYSEPSPGELVREEFAEYFCSQQGSVPWQYKHS